MYDRYCKIRDSKGLKDSDVSRISGVTKSTFSDWKAGRYTPKADKLKKIAEALDCPESYLIGFDEARNNRLKAYCSAMVEFSDKDKRNKEVIDLFEKLSREQQESIINLMKSMK